MNLICNLKNELIFCLSSFNNINELKKATQNFTTYFIVIS